MKWDWEYGQQIMSEDAFNNSTNSDVIEDVWSGASTELIT